MTEGGRLSQQIKCGSLKFNSMLVSSALQFAMCVGLASWGHHVLVVPAMCRQAFITYRDVSLKVLTHRWNRQVIIVAGTCCSNIWLKQKHHMYTHNKMQQRYVCSVVLFVARFTAPCTRHILFCV